MPGGVREDIIGNRYGMLTAIGRESGLVKCRCDCGTEKLIRLQPLKVGNVKSCGCNRQNANQAGANARKLDLEDTKSGLLTFLEEIPRPANRAGRSRWIRCRCDCGSTVELRVQAYTDQTTFSCGCVKKPAITARAKEIRDSKGEHWCPKGEHMVKSEGFSWKKNKKGLNGVSRSPYCKDCTNAMNRAAYKSTR